MQNVCLMISCLKDTGSWTSMVISLAQHGFGAESLELFERMLSFDIKPDHITYVGVISACTHMGLVKEGRKLEEAWNFIKNMPIEPDVIGWGSLLASSFVHKNMDLAKVGAEKLLKFLSILEGYARAYPAYKVDPPLADPKEGEIRVKNKAIGVNFVDIYHRTGVYKVPEIPCTPGVEAVGVVTAIGPGVNDLKVGDMVYHSGSGTYTEEKIVLADKAMPLPPIDPLIVASVVGKGLTAHFLVKSWFKMVWWMWCGCASAVVVADEDEGDDGVGGDDVVMLLVMMAAAVGGSHGGDVGWGWIGGGDEDSCGEVAGGRRSGAKNKERGGGG
ncbi:alcohol dehydrogenase superfamily protein [Tanacetum coccineum]|uniref:Alcohol dehydrogenase superfamily protein n=1 Tax=Tanacetum coccineum TaxID=301880 RepID=A0ABQ4ZC28_9ASTR